MIAQTKHINLLTNPAEVLSRNSSIVKTLKSLFLFFSLLTITFCSTNSFAQYTYELDKTTRFDKMGTEEGLSSAYATCIHQDKYGFIWIGTQVGINLYNGYEVNVFIVEPKNPQSIFNNYIIDIYEEPDGTIWFCTGKGLSRYNRQNQTFSNYIPDTLNLYSTRNEIKKIVQDGTYLWVIAGNDLLRFNKEIEQFQSFAKDTLNPSKGIYSNSVDYIFMDGSGTLWVATSKFGVNEDFALSRFNKENETFTHFPHDPSNPESIAGNAVFLMTEDHEGTIWIATHSSGLIKLIDKEKGIFRHYIHDKNDENSIIHNYIKEIFEDSQGNIWTGGAKGFSLLNKITGQFTNYHVTRIDSPDYLTVIREIKEDSNGELWMNTVDGLLRFNPSTNALVHYHYNPDNPSGISDNNVRQLTIDRSDQVWIANWSNGINSINRFSNVFRIIQNEPNNSNSLSNNYVSRFLKDSKGNLWIGCYLAGGLNRTKKNDHIIFDDFEHFVFEPDNPKSLTGNWINPIYEDHNQMIWIGAFTGLNSYDYRTNSITRYPHDPDDSTTISSMVVESIFEDSHGTLWVGTRNSLNIMDRETGKFIRFLPDDNEPTSIQSRDINVIFEDSFGNLWFGGEYLEKLNRKDTSFIHYLPDPGNVIDKYRTNIAEIEEDDSTNLWIATNAGGLYKMNRSNARFTALTTNDGLPSNTIEALKIDDNGDIWVATNQGLSRISSINQQIKNFDVADGVVNRELIFRSLYKDDDGWLYVGGRDGFNVFHPDSIKENKYIPPVYITSLTVAGEPKYFDKPLYEMSTIELEYNENDFSFDFVALNYINSQKNQYAFMLEGYDEDWNHVGNKHEATYTNMSSGEYKFRVKGSNNDGLWNEEGASLVLVIQPPFWETWWAYVIYALTFFSIVYLLRRNELKKINLRQELELEQINAEKLAELDIEKNKLFSNISHEFRTPLTVITGMTDEFASQMKPGEQSRFGEFLSMIKRNADNLLHLVNQMLDLSKLESGKLQLKPVQADVVPYLQYITESFQSFAESKGIKLIFYNEANTVFMDYDPDKLFTIVSNLLSNAIKFTHKGGKVICHLHTSQKSSSEKLILKVKDSGIGIPEEEIPNIFDRFFQVNTTSTRKGEGTGIGLSLTKELVTLMKGSITVISQENTGSEFKVSLPITRTAQKQVSKINAKNTENETSKNWVSEVSPERIVSGITESDDNGLSDYPLTLIVEDNEDVAKYIALCLGEDYKIHHAYDGQEGIDKALELIPDIIISDVMMPEKDGYEVCSFLKQDERTSHIPIILLTAKAGKESRLEGLTSGADAYLSKPFDKTELLVRMEKMIQLRLGLHQKYSGSNFKPGSARSSQNIEEVFLQKAMESVESNIDDSDFGNIQLARLLSMSESQLYRKLKALTGKSTALFIRSVRLQKAKELLKTTSLNISEIAYSTGFNDPAWFSRVFKGEFGESPVAFKEKG